MKTAHIGLTDRQIEVLTQIANARSNKQIAKDMGISESTVKAHVTAIFRALGVKNRTQAAIAAPNLITTGECVNTIGSGFTPGANGAKQLGEEMLQCDLVRVEQYGDDYVIVRDRCARPHCAIFEADYSLDEMVKRLSD